MNKHCLRGILSFECTANVHICHPQALCSDIGGHFTCTLINGYSGDGTFRIGKCLQKHLKIDFKVNRAVL